MVAPLERAIESLTEPGVAPGDALRTLLVVARRIKADDLAAWLNDELNGYAGGTTVPDYRRADLPVHVRFEGPFHSSRPMTLSALDLPAELAGQATRVPFHQPIAELVALAEGDGDAEPQIRLPMIWVQRFRDLAEQGKALRLEMHTLNEAAVIVPRTYLLGIVDRVKSAALNLALDLEAIASNAGSSDGPTITSAPDLAHTVTVHMQNIYAHQSSVQIGDHAAMHANIQVGDLDGLIDAARSLLDADAVERLRAAIEEDGGQPGPATKSFVDKVKVGAIGLAGGLTADLAHSGLHALLGQVFPGVS